MVLPTALLLFPVLVASPRALVAPNDGSADDTRASVPFSGPITFEFHPDPQDDDLERRVQVLERMATELQERLQSEHSATVVEFTRIEELVGSVTDAGRVGAPISGFRIGDTTLRIGGYVDFDFHTTAFDDGALPSGSPARDFYIPGATPVGGERTTTSDMTAQSTRFSVAATREVGDALATAYLETDYIVTTEGNERVSSSFAQRLRRA